LRQTDSVTLLKKDEITQARGVPYKKDKTPQRLQKAKESKIKNKKQNKKEIRIKINPLLGELVEQYLEACKKELPIIVNLAEANDFDKLSEIAHKMKGMGSSYGFVEITRFGEEIENACVSGDNATSLELIRNYSEYLDQVILE